LGIGGEFNLHEWQVVGIESAACEGRERGGESGMVKGGLDLLLRGVIQHKLWATGGDVAIPEASVIDPGWLYVVQHQRRSVVRQEFFSARVVGGGHGWRLLGTCQTGEQEQCWRKAAKSHHHASEN